MTDLSLFRFSHFIEVRFADIDGMGHVNNAKYFTYMETARIHYIREGVGWGGEPHRQGIILVRIACDFKLPLVYGDSVRVYVRTSRLGTKSFDMEYVVAREIDKAVTATGTSVQVAFDYDTDESIPIPSEWRARITAYEPGLEG